MDPKAAGLYIETPCISSPELSRKAGCNIFLKLENLQPGGSFKSRGIGTMMARAVSSSSTGKPRVFCSSGGNAGLACATAARSLGLSCDVFLPSVAPELVVQKLQSRGAATHRAGDLFPQADAACRKQAALDPDGLYVHPFDHPDLWDGHATLVDELAAQDANAFFGKNRGIDAIVCNVGGGGLLNGVMEGIERNYNTKSNGATHGHVFKPRPRVLAIETEGADSLAASIRAREHVTLPAMTSAATSLGAPRVSAKTFDWAQKYNATVMCSSPSSASEASQTLPQLVSAVVPDAAAVSACAEFLDDARLLIEMSCGATLASAYDGGQLLRSAFGDGVDDQSWSQMNVVLVVCGGSLISAELLAAHKSKFGV
ncbi:tryptophan synthase beta subunit-like PLP-dependent enzyme [Xylariaceae sp. FL1019]|nr:tryptophan synthase beta subunit-like PLP-dependent enzyme [Xylariaceae sp. FL1019]